LLGDLGLAYDKPCIEESLNNGKGKQASDLETLAVYSLYTVENRDRKCSPLIFLSVISIQRHITPFICLKLDVFFPFFGTDFFRFRYSFICQGTSTRRQWKSLFGLRVKLPPVTTSLITQT